MKRNRDIARKEKAEKIERLQRTSSIRRCATSLHQSPHMVTKASKIFRSLCGWISTNKTRRSFGNSPSAVTYCYVNCKKIYQVWEADWEAEVDCGSIQFGKERSDMKWTPQRLHLQALYFIKNEFWCIQLLWSRTLFQTLARSCHVCQEDSWTSNYRDERVPNFPSKQS